MNGKSVSRNDWLSRCLNTRLLGTPVGFVEYWLRPHIRRSVKPFNGQIVRQTIFAELLANVRFTAMVETGAYRGATTEYLQKTSQQRVYSVELHPRYYGYVTARFLLNRKVSIGLGDSRDFLNRLTHILPAQGECVFLYLDAHWPANLPLKEEIEIVFRAWPNSVVMIDDFRVPGDDGYGSDNYGEGQDLCLEYLAPLEHLNLAKYFPVQRSDEETGAKRGCIVLAKNPGTLANLKTLKRWDSTMSPSTTPQRASTRSSTGIA